MLRLLLAEAGMRPPGKGVSMTPEMAPEMGTLKATWMSGDYGTFAKYLEPSALEFLGRLRVEPGTEMLDVACADAFAASVGRRVDGPRAAKRRGDGADADHAA